MSKVIKFSEATALAFHAMLAMAKENRSRLTAHHIAKKFNASENHLKKVLQRLVKAGLASTSPGPTGGFSLQKDPSRITLLDIYEAIEGKYQASHCLFDPPLCKKRHVHDIRGFTAQSQ